MDPLVKEVRVEATVDDAFRRFTQEIGTWWPRSVHSVSREQCVAVTFGSAVGAHLMEKAEDGSVHVWGTITAWHPPTRVSFTWHPGRGADGAQDVTVSFEPDGDGALVRLVHTGWERLGEAAADTRRGYDEGWDGVLGLFSATF